MKYFFSSLMIALALLAGCANKVGASTSGQPDWVAGDSLQYPKSQYLTGRGSASSVDEAKRRAQADLSEIFQVNISATNDSTLNVKSNGRDEQISSDVTRRISTTTEQIISGIEIAETWQHPATRDYYVLAVLKKQTAATRLRQQIDELEQGVSANLKQARESGDIIERITAMNRALDTQNAIEGLQKSLRVVSASGMGADVQYNSGNLKVEMDKLLKQVRIVAQAEPGSVDGLAEVVAGALSKAGFKVENGGNATFIMKASLQTSDLGLIDRMYWQRGTLEVTLIEAATGNIRGTQQWPIKTSARDRATAAKRVLSETDTILKSELGDAIIGMATSTK